MKTLLIGFTVFMCCSNSGWPPDPELRAAIEMEFDTPAECQRVKDRNDRVDQLNGIHDLYWACVPASTRVERNP